MVTALTDEQNGLTESTCHKMRSLLRTCCHIYVYVYKYVLYAFKKLNAICNVRDLKITIALNTAKITEGFCPL